MKWLLLALALVSSPSHAGVFDGQAVNATVTNAAFLAKNQNDADPYVLSLTNALTASGTSVTNVQAQLNSCSSFTGDPINGTYNALPSWTNNDVGSSSDNLKVRVDAITAKFNSSSGHIHSGSAGDAPKIPDSSLVDSYFLSDGSRSLGGILDQVQQSTPPTPSSGHNKLYFKSDDNLYYETSTGSEIELATSLSSGTVTNVATGTGLTGGPITTTGTISMANVGAYTVKGNNTASSTAPSDLKLSDLTGMMFSPTVQRLTSGSSATYYLTYMFYVSSASATAGATYTNNSQTFTVTTTISGATILQTTGTGVPLSSGTLTKASGTGDATITFVAFQSPRYLRVQMVGGGGGGGGANGSGAAGSASDSTFGNLTANAGSGATGTNSGGGGGSASIGSGWVGNAIIGGGGEGTVKTPHSNGGRGGGSFFSGGGHGGWPDDGNGAANANTGEGGGGGAGNATVSGGGGGGAGGYVDAVTTGAPSASYTYTVGAGGAGGSAGASGVGAGATGGSGLIVVWEFYQ